MMSHLGHTDIGKLKIQQGRCNQPCSLGPACYGFGLRFIERQCGDGGFLNHQDGRHGPPELCPLIQQGC